MFFKINRRGAETQRKYFSYFNFSAPQRLYGLPFLLKVYRADGRTGQISVVADDINRPTRLAFSPDESKLYVIEAGVVPHLIYGYGQ